MKRTLTTAVLGLLAWAGAAAIPAVTVTPSTASPAPGDALTLTIALDNGEEAVTALQLDLTAPATLQTGAEATATERLAAHTLSLSKSADGLTTRLLVWSAQNAAIAGTSGALATLPLTVSAATPEGEVMVKVSTVRLASTDGALTALPDSEVTLQVGRLTQSISWETEAASLRVGESLALSATATSGLPVAYAITEGAECASIVNGRLYASAAGSVTVTASQAGDSRHAAAEPQSLAVTVLPFDAPGTYVFTASEVNIWPGANPEVAVALHNQAAVTAMQLDVVAPEGILVSDAATAERAGAHTLATSTPTADTTRLLLWSADNAAIDGNDGNVLTLALRLDDDTFLEPGDYEVSLCNARLVEPAGVSHYPDDMAILVHVHTEEVGLAPTLVATPSDDDTLYDLSGRPVATQPAPGIYVRGGRKVAVTR